MQRIRYAFIGCGAINQRRHLPEAAADPHSQIVAIADPFPGRAGEWAQRYEAAAFDDSRKMLDTVACDAVVIGVPNALHADMTIDALERGLHVLLEKPMCTTLADADRVIAAADAAERRVMLAMNKRFMDHYVEARSLVAAGRIGRPLTFETVFKHPGTEGWSVDGAESWFTDRSRAGLGVIGDLAVHKIDLIRFLLDDEFADVSAIVSTLDKTTPDGDPIDVDDNALLTLRTRGGAAGAIVCSWTAYGVGCPRYTVVHGSAGSLLMGMRQPNELLICDLDGTWRSQTYGSMNRHGWPHDSRVLSTFTRCLLDGAAPPVDAHDGRADLAVVLAAIESAKSKRVVSIDR